MRSVSILIVFLFLSGSLLAQSYDDQVWQSMIEQWAEQNDSEIVPDEIIEDLATFIDYPINLNDTASDLLTALPFLTDLHRDIIKAYIAQNGEMVTMAELHFLNGFDSLQIRLLYLFTTVEHVERSERFSLREMLHNGHSNLRLGFKTLYPRSRGYEEEKYLGSPYRYYFRYIFQYSNRITFQLSADKDAGEPLGGAALLPHKANIGFDYYGYHLMFNDFGIVKNAIVGKYQLQFGQGVTLWSGFAPWVGMDMPLRRYGQGIRPASAFCEYGFLRGAATTLSLIPNHLEATLFYSFVNRDATLSSSDSSLLGPSVFSALYNSGYHRSETEIAKKGALGEQVAGTHLQYKTSSFILGATAFGTFFSDEIHPESYVYNAFAFSGKRLFNAGIDASWRYKRSLFFGEVSTSLEHDNYMPDNSPLSLAAVVGFQSSFNSDNGFSAVYHYGSPSYHNFFSNTVGQSSTTQNESGVIFSFHALLPLGLRMAASADFFHFPWMRYRLYAPSYGADYRLRLQKNINSYSILSFQYQYKSSFRNSDLQQYAVEPITRQRFSLHIDYNRDGWHLLSRIILSSFHCLDHSPEHGFLMQQDIGRTFSLSGKELTISARASIFDISAYDARIYTYESDMMYEFSAPMLMNRGIRCYLLLRFDFSKDLSLAMKYGVSYYPEEDSLGSGYDITSGNSRHEIKAQLRLRF